MNDKNPYNAQYKVKISFQTHHKNYISDYSSSNSVVFLLFLSFLIFNSCASLLDASERREDNRTRFSENGMPSEPGKCYAKCLMPDQYEYYEEDILLYTGNDNNEEGVKFQKFLIRPKTTEWVKKKMDGNCNAPDPNDCLVWCMNEVPEIAEEHYVVVDTNLVKEYKWTTISYKELEKAGGFTEWREVVCGNDVTPRFYKDVQKALVENGYDITADGEISKETKEALVKYQKENGLPVGSLDIETLSSLGVEY